MLHYALMFLIVGLIAGALGLFGVAQVASQIAWVLFLIAVILVVIHDVHVVGLKALARRRTRSAWPRVHGVEDAVRANVLMFLICREGLQLIASVGQRRQHALHPLRVPLQRSDVGKWPSMRENVASGLQYCRQTSSHTSKNSLATAVIDRKSVV